MMSAFSLHYVFDPLCGWCYAAAPLVAVARELLPVHAHGGGMMAGPLRRKVTPELRAFVMPQDHRIAQMSGQPFGERYFEGLLRDPLAVLDSEPPITAILAAEALTGGGLDLLARMQRAHYVEGRRIADVEVLAELAGDIGLDGTEFRQSFERLSGVPTEQHIGASRELLTRVGGNGFPTLALERDGNFVLVDLVSFLGQPQRWREALASQVEGLQ